METMEQARHAGRYALEAARLLVRRPSFLLVALLFAAVAPVDTEVFGYLLQYRTPLGREMLRAEKETRSTAAKRDQRDGKRHAVDKAQARREWQDGSRLLITSPAFPGLSIPTMLATPWALIYRPTGKPIDPARGPPGRAGYLLVLWLLYSPVAHAVEIFTAGGYLAVLRSAVVGAEVRWSRFFGGARRVFWRLVVCTIGFEALHYPISKAGTAFPGLPGLIMGWALVAGAIWLLLWESVIVWDQCGVIAALQRSADLVSRSAAVAVLLGVGAGLTQWLVAFPRWTFGAWLAAQPTSLAQAQSLAWPALAVSLTWAAVGAWFCAAAFVWYREESRRASQPAAADNLDILA